MGINASAMGASDVPSLAVGLSSSIRHCGRTPGLTLRLVWSGDPYMPISTAVSAGSAS
jgi:hypothetical protein